MSAFGDLKFVIFRDMKDGYRWKLSSATVSPVAASERGHADKGACEQDVHGLIDDRHPHAKVRDATIW
jgi:hypothetical protein